jgi:hypothetical protein
VLLVQLANLDEVFDLEFLLAVLGDFVSADKAILILVGLLDVEHLV